MLPSRLPILKRAKAAHTAYDYSVMSDSEDEEEDTGDAASILTTASPCPPATVPQDHWDAFRYTVSAMGFPRAMRPRPSLPIGLAVAEP